jgi:hypothetical protein
LSQLPNAIWAAPKVECCEVRSAPPGSKSTSRAERSRRKLGGPAFGQSGIALVRIGKVKSRSR